MLIFGIEIPIDEKEPGNLHSRSAGYKSDFNSLLKSDIGQRNGNRVFNVEKSKVLHID